MSGAVKQKYNILFLATWYPSRLHPSNGIFIKRHALAVYKYCNVNVLYVASDADVISKTYDIIYSNEDSLNTVRVYYKKVLSNIPVVSTLLKLFRFVKSTYIGINELKKRGGHFDLIHVNIVIPIGLIAIICKYLYGIPYVITENWTGYLPSDGTYKGFLIKLITKLIVNNAQAVTTVSEDLKKAMLSHKLHNEYFITPNVVDVDLFNIGEKTSSISKAQILHVSTLEDIQKNITGILSVVKKLSYKRQDFEFHIVGAGPQMKLHIRTAQESGIYNKTVFFYGYKSPAEIAGMMHMANFFVLFSNFENLPCVMIEAFASGIPVIATKTGGIPEHIYEHNGILVEPQNEDQLLDAIESMLGNYSKYNPHQIRKYAVDNFSYERVGMQFLEVYKKIIK